MGIPISHILRRLRKSVLNPVIIFSFFSFSQGGGVEVADRKRGRSCCACPQASWAALAEAASHSPPAAREGSPQTPALYLSTCPLALQGHNVKQGPLPPGFAAFPLTLQKEPGFIATSDHSIAMGDLEQVIDCL